ncbi:VOC family protein [Aliiglaciecola sp. M165]|uniref:VOC family protein n=1 Tax=Aliiglaciecola sp. M165 TaxID=2593649 RepID=UPI0011810B51|nr:VOC family protein [Aliiglaciecola sp. M165]TRY33763.1 VOC family protein [Aliiglaciecola sp. M165]
MVRLEHLNLVVTNMQETLAFYSTAFPHWKVRERGEAIWYGTNRQWLHFGDEYNYLTFNDKGTGENRNLQSDTLGLAHFAFEVSNLDAIKQRMLDAGYAIANNGAMNAFRKNVYFIDPSGFEVEFVEYLSDIPKERNNNNDEV